MGLLLGDASRPDGQSCRHDKADPADRFRGPIPVAGSDGAAIPVCCSGPALASPAWRRWTPDRRRFRTAVVRGWRSVVPRGILRQRYVRHRTARAAPPRWSRTSQPACRYYGRWGVTAEPRHAALRGVAPYPHMLRSVRQVLLRRHRPRQAGRAAAGRGSRRQSLNISTEPINLQSVLRQPIPEPLRSFSL